MEKTDTEMHVNIKYLCGILQNSGKKYDMEKIERAFAYAQEMHAGQFRASGEPYISHPVAVAEIVAELGLDTDSICAALLHDTVEDSPSKADIKTIEKKFGPEVALLVDGLTKMVMLEVKDKEEAHIENLRKMLLAMSKDIRVIFIKLCDRLHNMRTLGAKPEEKRRATALETMHVFAPLAHRLGMQRIKHELENLSLAYLDPIGYEEVKHAVEEKYGQNYSYIEQIRGDIDRKLRETIGDFQMEGRIKSVYSIYRKMYNQNKSFDEIYDFYALRIIVNTELECYTVLGIIHEMYNSIPGRFKDYISTPKPNLYRSLHTTVIGHEGIPFEVQIRTKEMHEIAEYGIAAHWKYKSGSSAKDDMDKKLEWVSKLIETESDTKDPDEFMNAIKTDIFHDEVFVFTPKGDVISLPQGATVIDFAFFIHSAIGCRMTGAKINGAIVPIDHVLNNGEIVEIQTTNSDKGPSRDWLNIVKTSEARNKIRQWFKKEKRADNIVVGRSMVETEMRKYGRGLSDEDQAEIIENVASKTGYGSVDDLYNSLGYGGIPLSKILPKLADEYKKKQDEYQKRDEGPEELPARLFTQPDASKGRSTGKGVIIDGEGGMQVKFARCCNPLPGDSIVGFVTKGFGISVHKIDCPNILQAAKTEEGERRLVSARWSDDARGADTTYETMLQIFVEDRIGVIAELCAVLAEMRVQIVQINSTNASTGNCVVNIKILCRNREHYEAIVGKLKTLKAVRDVNRGFA